MELIEKVTEKTILVVDDEEPIRWSLARSFRREGYRVLTAESGEEALRAIQEKTPDLILLDLRLPDIHGLEVLQTIHAGRRGIAVIVLTAGGDAETRAAALEAGACDYLVKPFNLAEVKGSIREALAGLNASGGPGQCGRARGPR